MVANASHETGACPQDRVIASSTDVRTNSTPLLASEPPSRAHALQVLAQPSRFTAIKVDPATIEAAREGLRGSHSFWDPVSWSVISGMGACGFLVTSLLFLEEKRMEGVVEFFSRYGHLLSSPEGATARLVATGVAVTMLGICTAIYATSRRAIENCSFGNALSHLEHLATGGVSSAAELTEAISDYTRIINAPESQRMDLARSQVGLFALTEGIPEGERLKHLARMFSSEDSTEQRPNQLASALWIMDPALQQSFIASAAAAIKSTTEPEEQLAKHLLAILGGVSSMATRKPSDEQLEPIACAIMQHAKTCPPVQGYELLKACMKVFKPGTLLHENLREAANAIAAHEALPDL